MLNHLSSSRLSRCRVQATQDRQADARNWVCHSQAQGQTAGAQADSVTSAKRKRDRANTQAQGLSETKALRDGEGKRNWERGDGRESDAGEGKTASTAGVVGTAAAEDAGDTADDAG